MRMDGVDENSDSDQFSDDELYANLPENEFDLFYLTEEERARLGQVMRNRVNNNLVVVFLLYTTVVKVYPIL